MAERLQSTPKKSTNDDIIKWRQKWSRRMFTEGSGIVDAKSICDKMPACVCDRNRVIPTPCHQCVVFFLEQRADRAVKECERKLDVVDKANTATVTALRKQLADNDTATIAQLRKSIAEKDTLIEQIRHLNLEKDEAYNNLNDMYTDRLNEGINDERRINEMKAKVESAENNSRVLQNNALILINFIHNVSGETIPDEVKKAISVFSKTKLARSYHLDRIVSAAKGTQTELSQSHPNPGTQAIISEIQTAFSQAVSQGDLMSQFARKMVKHGFLEEIKKLLLSPEISHDDICQFRRLFERDLHIKSRDYFTTQHYYDEVKSAFFPKVNDKYFERLEKNFVFFVQFKCNQTGAIFGVLVCDALLIGSDTFKANATYQVPAAVTAHLKAQRKANKDKKNDAKKRKHSDSNEEPDEPLDRDEASC